MDEIRFNQPLQKDDKKEVGVKKKKNSSFLIRRILKLFGIIAILAIVVLAVFLGKDFLGGMFKTESKTYNAVFLTNGQVYFGRLINKSDSEFKLIDVYYLQLSKNKGLTGTEPNQSKKFSLIKLGSELHGPTDELYINASQVLFYEKLRSDSRVVQAIKNYK